MAADGTAETPTRTAQMDTRPLVVDTDLGPDDLVALAWLAGQPGIDLRAVTLSGTGRATCPDDLARLRAVLVALELGDVPVGCGSATPSAAGGSPYPTAERTAAATLHGLVLPPAPEPVTPPRTAEEVIATVLHTATDPISFLALGPLTTIAAAVQDPDMGVRVASVTASLGALDGPGDVVPPGATAPGPAEWNAHADPAAVSAVLARVPLVLVTEDVARAVTPSATLLDALAAGGDGAGARLVAALLAADPDLVAGGWVPRDVLAAVSLRAPEVVETRERMLTVASGGPDAGALMASGGGLPAQVTVSADRAAFEVELLAGLRGEDARALASPAGRVVISGGPAGCALDAGSTSAPGRILVEARATDGPFVAVLASLAEGHDLAELRAVLETLDPAEAPPEWLLVTAYLEVDEAGVFTADAELTPGDHAAICITGDAAAPRLEVAPDLLRIGGPDGRGSG